MSLLKSKSLYSYNNKLSKNSIIYFLLLKVKINDYKKSLYSILIVSLKYYNIILRKLWINKYEVLLNIIKNKILFISRRYEYDYNTTFSYSDLSFILNTACTSILRTILKRSLISTVEDKTIRDINSLLRD